MTTIAVDGLHAGTERKRGFFARVLAGLSEAQMMRARGLAKPHLLALTDEELAQLGYTRAEIAQWPQGYHWL